MAGNGVVAGWLMWMGLRRIRTRNLVQETGLALLPKAEKGGLPGGGDRPWVIPTANGVEGAAVRDEAACSLQLKLAWVEPVERA